MRKTLKFFVVGLCMLSAFCFAEEAPSDKKVLTVEEAYLSSVEGVVIRELVLAEGRDAKFVALQYIEDALNSGRQTEDILVALETLATIGLSTVEREGGRVVNNFPDVRMKACELLGSIGGEEAKDTLVKVLYIDNEPSVLMSAVRGLGDVGINENDEVSDMIVWIAKKFDVINPTSSLALEVLNVLEKLAPQIENKRTTIEVVMRIASNYKYITSVRNRALEVLKSLGAGSN